MGQLSKAKYSNLQRIHGRALAFMLPVDVLELTDPPTLDVDGLKVATATVAAPVTLTKDGGDFIANGLAELAAVPGGRQLTFTTAGSTPADAPATATVVGLDSNGNEATEVVTLAQTAAAATSATCWTDITSITYPAADGTDATIAIGWNNVFGLPSKAFLRGGGIPVVFELEDGAAPTAGTFIAPASAAPNGGYTPNSTPNGSLDFHLCYEVDASALDL